jgi:hypothetical protein
MYVVFCQEMCEVRYIDAAFETHGDALDYLRSKVGRVSDAFYIVKLSYGDDPEGPALEYVDGDSTEVED